MTAPQQAQARSNISTAIEGYLYGLTLSNNSGDPAADIDFAAGKCASDETNPQLIVETAKTKRLDANWAAGTNQGMRDSAVAIANGTYHLYAVSKANGADPDFYAHTSTVIATVLAALQVETGGSLYVHARRIGTILREGGTIVGFTQIGDEFRRLQSSSEGPGASGFDAAAANITISVPTGLNVTAIFNAFFSAFSTATGAGLGYLYSPIDSDNGAGSTVGRVSLGSGSSAASSQQGGEFRITTNTSAQIRGNASADNCDLYVSVRGWTDTRGRLG